MSARGEICVAPDQIGVIFDCDGTLIDSMGVWREVEDGLAARAGATLSVADVDEIAASSIPEVGQIFFERFGLGESAQEVVDMIYASMMAFYTTKACALPGALELVRGLVEAGVHVSVASSTPKSLLEAALKHCGFTPYLQAIVSVDDVGQSKRSAAVYDRARDEMGTALRFTWGVEDAAYALATLRHAQYHTLGVYDDDLAGTYEELAQLADRAVYSLADVCADDFIAWTRGANACKRAHFCASE
ncbi:HAD family phosphatase [Eggerthellaceae bacterium 3-80]|nr:HAD family phosphatase [bacterium D16-34]